MWKNQQINIFFIDPPRHPSREGIYGIYLLIFYYAKYRKLILYQLAFKYSV